MKLRVQQKKFKKNHSLNIAFTPVVGMFWSEKKINFQNPFVPERTGEKESKSDSEEELFGRFTNDLKFDFGLKQEKTFLTESERLSKHK